MKVCGKMIHSISGQEMWFQVPVDRKQPKRVRKKRSRGDNNNGNNTVTWMRLGCSDVKCHKIIF